MPAFTDRSKRILLGMLGLVLFLCGMAFLVLYGEQQTLTCQRDGKAMLTCRQQASWFNLFPLGATRVIASPQLAKIEMNCRTDGETAGYGCYNDGVQLITPAESISLSGDFNETTAQETIERLNRFFDSTERQIIIDSANWSLAILGLACVVMPFLICGVGLLIFSIKGFPLRQT